MTSGIYSITHPRAKGCYIGQAVNLDRRDVEHGDDLAGGKHHNFNLQKIANAYGVKGFRFKVVERCDRPALDYEELKWIAKQGTWNIRPNQQQAKAALSKGKTKKRFKAPSGIRFVFWAACGVLGWLVMGVIGFWICTLAGAIVTWAY